MTFLVITLAMLATFAVGGLIEHSRHLDAVCDLLLPDHPRDRCGETRPGGWVCIEAPHRGGHYFAKENADA